MIIRNQLLAENGTKQPSCAPRIECDEPESIRCSRLHWDNVRNTVFARSREITKRVCIASSERQRHTYCQDSYS